MLNLPKVAITGGVASGKTTVCQFFEKLGAYTVSADAIVHELLNPQTDLGQKVLRTLGSDILHDGKIDRSRVAAKVFQNPDALRKLEEILHPAVMKRIEERYESARNLGRYSLFVAEIPLLFEIGAESSFDAVIAVVADQEIAKKRFESSGKQPQEYERRMHRQLSQVVKSGKAQYTIKNNGTLHDLQKQVEKVYAILKA